MLFPVLVAVAGYGVEEVVVIAALAVVVIARHAANLRRLFHGRELRTGEGDAEPERRRRRYRRQPGPSPVENLGHPGSLGAATRQGPTRRMRRSSR